MPPTSIYPAGYPVYAVAFAECDRVILAGGGGRGRTGIKNKLEILDISSETPKTETALILEDDEDAPMALEVHPKDKTAIAAINSTPLILEKGENVNLRLFDLSETTLSPKEALSTTTSTDTEVYDRVLRFSPDYAYLAVGSTSSEVTVLSWPEKISVELPKLDFAETDEIFDLFFNESSTMFGIVTGSQVVIMSLSQKTKAERVQIIERPTFRRMSAPCTFRAARFGYGSKSRNLYTLVNAPPSGYKSRDRLSLVSIWDSKTWKSSFSRRVSKKPGTCLDISDDGRFLAIATADLSIHILDSFSLKKIFEYKNAHQFPSTALKFSPKENKESSDDKCKWLVSASADNNVRLMQVKDISKSGGLGSTSALFLLALLLIVIATFGGRYYQPLWKQQTLIRLDNKQ